MVELEEGGQGGGGKGGSVIWVTRDDNYFQKTATTTKGFSFFEKLMEMEFS